VSRPQTLGEVVSTVAVGAKPFGAAMDEFVDAFYLDHSDKVSQQRRLNEAPAVTGDAFMDAWIGAVGEHLARRWNLDVPSWTRQSERYRLSSPRFIPDSKALRRTLLVESPAAFRSRMIFTFVEPLQRARFPRNAKRIGEPA
jgi:hypothetical protein